MSWAKHGAVVVFSAIAASERSFAAVTESATIRHMFACPSVALRKCGLVNVAKDSAVLFSCRGKKP